MLHQIKQVFHSPKFVVGFVIFVFLLLFSILYPIFSPYGPMEMVGNIFYAPGTYVSVVDTAQSSEKVTMNVDTAQATLDATLTDDTRNKMKTWLVNQAGIAESDIDIEDTETLISLWNENYDPELSTGMITADKRAYERLNTQITGVEQSLAAAAKALEEAQREATAAAYQLETAQSQQRRHEDDILQLKERLGHLDSQLVQAEGRRDQQQEELDRHRHQQQGGQSPSKAGKILSAGPDLRRSLIETVHTFPLAVPSPQFDTIHHFLPVL